MYKVIIYDNELKKTIFQFQTDKPGMVISQIVPFMKDKFQILIRSDKKEFE